MTTDKLNEFKKNLLKQKKYLLSKLHKIAAENPKIKSDFIAKYPDFGNEIDDDVQETQEYMANLRTTDEYENMLVEVEDALKRIAAGTYGICEKTGEEIPEERLKAIPTAKYIVAATPKIQHPIPASDS